MATEWKAKKKKKKQWMPTMSCTICRVRRSSSRSAAGSQSCKCWMGDKSMPRTFTPLMLQHEFAFHWHRWPNSTLHGAWVYIGHWHHWPNSTLHGAWVYIGHWHHWPNSTLHGAWVYIGHWHHWPNSTLHGAWVYIGHWHHWPNSTLHGAWVYIGHWHRWPNSTLHGVWVYISHWHHWPNSTVQGAQVYISHWQKWPNTMLQHMFTWVTDTTDETPHCTGYKFIWVTDTNDPTPCYSTRLHESPTPLTKLHTAWGMSVHQSLTPLIEHTAQVHISHQHKWPNSTLHKFTWVTNTNDQTPCYSTCLHESPMPLTKLHTTAQVCVLLTALAKKNFFNVYVLQKKTRETGVHIHFLWNENHLWTSARTDKVLGQRENKRATLTP